VSVVEAACRAAGAHLVSTPGEMIDLAQALLRARPLAGPRVADSAVPAAALAAAVAPAAVAVTATPAAIAAVGAEASAAAAEASIAGSVAAVAAAAAEAAGTTATAKKAAAKAGAGSFSARIQVTHGRELTRSSCALASHAFHLSSLYSLGGP